MVRLSPVAFGLLRSCAIAALMVLAPPAPGAAPDPGQIFKCTDGSGNVTYQNEPCPKNVKAGKVEIFDNSWTSDRAEKEAEWRRNAIEHRVVTGMPLPWVREALGEPAEVRDTATAGAAEVWLYSFPDRSVQVGLLNNQVLWFREAPVAAAAAARATPGADRPALRSAPEPQVARAPAVDQPARDLPVTRLTPPVSDAAPRPPEPQVARAPAVDQPARDLPVTRLTPSVSDAAPRPISPAQAEPARPDAAAAPAAPTSASLSAPVRAVARGQDCKQAIAALGPPDRQRDVPALDAGTDPTTEYFYEPSAGSGATRTRVVCANGKVEGVDRSAIR